MAKNAATEQELGALHKKVVDRVTREVDDPECDPRFVQMAIKILSDNKVTMVTEISNELGELEKNLKKRKTRFGKDVTNVIDMATKVAEDIAMEG
jgi:hypothetical protein